MQNNKNIAFVFLVGIVVGVLGWNIVSLAIPSPVYAEATSGSANGIIAVTGLATNNSSCLWVMSTADEKTSPTLCMYLPENSGKSFRLAAARRIKWDLQMLQYNDTSDKRYSPSKLRDNLESVNKDAEKNSK